MAGGYRQDSEIPQRKTSDRGTIRTLGTQRGNLLYLVSALDSEGVLAPEETNVKRGAAALGRGDGLRSCECERFRNCSRPTVFCGSIISPSSTSGSRSRAMADSLRKFAFHSLINGGRIGRDCLARGQLGNQPRVRSRTVADSIAITREKTDSTSVASLVCTLDFGRPARV
jgi:hypothetical protein